MPTVATKTKSAVVPALRYADAKKAVKWLCDAFGFKEKLVVPGAGDAIAHAELTFDGGMLMLGSITGGEFDKYLKLPKDLNGANSQTLYVIVPDADQHYARAKKAGARILIDIRDESYGGRGYSCADFEGHVWTFGTYDPWAAQ